MAVRKRLSQVAYWTLPRQHSSVRSFQHVSLHARISLVRAAVVAALATVPAISGCAERPGDPTAFGAEVYEACAPCHGASGEGSATLGVPAIAALPDAYLSGQLERFRSGMRGHHADDADGLRMQAMARQLHSSDEVVAVSRYVASLRRNGVTAAPITAATSFGQQTYVLCAPCHGVDGQGRAAMKVPPLAGLEEWYVKAQIRKFRNGIRGAMPDDGLGAAMRAVAGRLSDENIDQVVAYVQSLPIEQVANR